MRILRARLGPFALPCTLVLAACGGGEPTSDASTSTPPDAAVAADAMTISIDAAVLEEDATALDADRPVGGGSVSGVVTRSAMPAAGGRGSLYVALFTTDPVVDRTGAMRVADVRIENADMSGPGARISYAVTGIPPRAEPYYVAAFLDDNDTVDPTDPAHAGPDRGDLVALMGFSSIQVAVTDERPVALDIDLNFNLPF